MPASYVVKEAVSLGLLIAGFLTSHLGISNLILRAVIQLKNSLDKSNA
ncbi:MAG: hypothetical protein WEC35_01700 [Nitrosopumilaceae archaeon]